MGKDSEEAMTRVRATQVQESMAFTTRMRRDRPTIKNIIFGGDCNWDDVKTSGRKAYADGDMAALLKTDFATWSDAWLCKHPSSLKNSDDENGFTYDVKKNEMLSSKGSLRRRFDRILFDNISEMKLSDVSIVTLPVIKGLQRPIYKWNSRVIDRHLPVTASDHFGLRATFKP